MKRPTIHWVMLGFKLAVIVAMISVSSGSLPLTQPAAAATGTTIYLPIIFKQITYNWLQFNGDMEHSGNNPSETKISTSNATQLTLLFQVGLAGVADGAPAYLADVNTSSEVRNLIFVTTRDGTLEAVDAHSGAMVWSKQYGAVGCLINNNLGRNEACYTTSSPAIDPTLDYVYSYGLDGYVHKYAVGDGSEVTTGGWPELTTLKRYDEKGSSALAIATAQNGTSYLYVAQAGYPGDQGNYQGHITAINLSNGAQKVFNMLCSNQAVHFVDSRVSAGVDCTNFTMSAVWSRPGVTYDSYHDRILMATGNGTFSPGSFMWGDTVISLNPDGSGTAGMPLDSYTPVNYQQLQDVDADLGSTAPAILPPSNGKYPHLAVQGGKDGILRLLNLDQLSGLAGVGHTGGEVFSIPVPMGGVILPQPAVWVNPSDHSTWVFVTNSAGSAGLQLAISPAGDPSLSVKWTSGWGSSAVVANGVLFIAQSGLIRALNATTGSLLWSNNQIGGIHWESPIVANGVVYISDQSGKLTAYSIP